MQTLGRQTCCCYYSVAPSACDRGGRADARRAALYLPSSTFSFTLFTNKRASFRSSVRLSFDVNVDLLDHDQKFASLSLEFCLSTYACTHASMSYRLIFPYAVMDYLPTYACSSGCQSAKTSFYSNYLAAGSDCLPNLTSGTFRWIGLGGWGSYSWPCFRGLLFVLLCTVIPYI